jgi:dCTP deaminase
MTVVNGAALFAMQPIVGMLPTKERAHGVSHGLVEVGYDIQIKQNVQFFRSKVMGEPSVAVDGIAKLGRFTIASAMEEFIMPRTLMGIVHDKSTWARRGLSVFNTVIEPGWKGFLTLELVYHGQEDLFIPAGSGIAQVVFHEIHQPAAYEGKYQNQEDRPVEALPS